MSHRSLILYYSLTGNTEKVANRFKEMFDRKGWECDLLKVDKYTDTKNSQFDLDSYDFLCVGSPVYGGQPPREIIDMMWNNPQSAHFRGEGGPSYKRVIPGTKKGIVFVTHGGPHLGPKEAKPALLSLEVEMEHLKFICIGSFVCPGAMKHGATEGWYGDISQRPNERDLKKAEIFIEEKIDELHLE